MKISHHLISFEIILIYTILAIIICMCLKYFFSVSLWFSNHQLEIIKLKLRKEKNRSRIEVAAKNQMFKTENSVGMGNVIALVFSLFLFKAHKIQN